MTSNHHPPSLNQSSIDTILTLLITLQVQPGYEEKPEQAEEAHKKDNKTGGPSMSMDQDVEFLKARQSHARQFQLNEMRNKERSIAELLSIQTESMDALYPTFIENEMNRRYLLEAAVLQRGKLQMPRTARQSKATPKLSDWYKCGHLLSTQDIKDLQATHEITSASDGCWTVHKVAPDHPSQRSVTVFVNNQTKVTQMGEPLDLRCRRSRSSFREEKWSVMSRYLPKASVITRSGIKLVSDPDGGLLYYHPVYDRYASSDSFDNYVSNETIMDTIRRREGIRAEMKAADTDRYGRSLNTRDKKKQQTATTAATSTGAGGGGGGMASEGDYFLEHPNLVQEKLSGYRHATDASIERDVLEYPEPNIWAGILLPPNIIKPAGGGQKKNAGAITAIKGSKQPFSGGSTSITPRNNVEGPIRDLNSPSAGVTPGPQDYKKKGNNNDNSGNGGSENQPENNALGSPHAAAEKFVSNLSVPAPGGGNNTMMRPFSAGSTFGSEAYATSANNNNMSLEGSIVNFDEPRPGTAPESGGNMPVTRRGGNNGLSLLIQEQQATLANSGPAAMKKTLTALTNPYGVVDPIFYEEEMDHSTYAEYRGLIHKIAEEPRNPVLLLKLSSFLYTKKMDHACMAALNRTIEVLEEWNLTSESSSMLQILRSKVGVRVYGKYADLSDMKEHAVLCKDSPTILSQIAMYYNRLKYMEQAEQLYIAALLIDPLHAEANRGYAHVLIQKSNFQAANRYFVRVYSHSLCYSIVKAEQGWLQEMQGADDEAIVQAFKKCLSLGNRDRGTVCALYSLGHFFHVRKDFAKAVDFYRRSLMYDPNEFETLLLLGCLGNSLPHGEKKYNKYQIDSWMRRGLLMQQRGASRWVALLIYAENLIANFGDFDRAEMYLWQAVNDSYSKEIWAVVSLAHYYQYTLCNPQRAKRLLLWSAKSRADAAKVKVKADPHNVVHNRLYESSGVGLEESTDSGFGQGIAFRDGMNNHSAEENALKNKREGENYFRMKMHGEEAVLHVAAAYACLDVKNFAGARKHADTALTLDAELGPAHRCMGLILYRQRENRKAALKHFNECLDLCGNTALLEAGGGNEHSLRTCAIVLSMEGSYTRALHYMRTATATADSVHVLSWRAYAIMTYLYGEGTHKELATSVIPLLTRAIELSEDTDVESMIMKGQLLMELQQPVEARQCFQKAMGLTPNDPVLLASMALCLAAIGFRSPASATQADYDAKFQDMRSIGELSLVEDPELLFQAATNPSMEARVKEAKAKAADGKPRDPTVLSAVRFPTVLSSSSQITEEPAEIEATVKDKRLLPPPTGEDQSSINYRKPRDVESDVLYWRGMHQMQQKGSDSMEKAKASFTRAVQRSDCPPHPLALYMLGWITELRGDLKVAERYYCYALQLEPIDSLYFLRLQKLAKDTLSYVRGLAKTTEKAEAHRKKVLKKKNKLRRRGVSVPIGFEADETGEQAVALATMRKRMLLHERVHKLAAMRQEQLGKRLDDLNTPGKCVSLDPFWQERLLHAFTECDDWASLLRSSNVYKKS
jgi:tetratricopeptide (TPR) repeat protein